MTAARVDLPTSLPAPLPSVLPLADLEARWTALLTHPFQVGTADGVRATGLLLLDLLCRVPGSGLTCPPATDLCTLWCQVAPQRGRPMDDVVAALRAVYAICASSGALGDDPASDGAAAAPATDPRTDTSVDAVVAARLQCALWQIATLVTEARLTRCGYERCHGGCERWAGGACSCGFVEANAQILAIEQEIAALTEPVAHRAFLQDEGIVAPPVTALSPAEREALHSLTADADPVTRPLGWLQRRLLASISSPSGGAPSDVPSPTPGSP